MFLPLRLFVHPLTCLCRRAFRTGRAPILIATGISARGWDIKDVKHIINYDLPSCMYGGIREYVHRIGRTARIGHQGLATSFYNDRNEDIAQDLVNVLVECDCPVPDFLSHLAPEEGAALQFDDDTDDEAEDGDAAMADNDGGAPVGGAWGTAPAEDGAPAANAWGAAPAENGDAGFTADGGAGASAW
jgi:ATP-dependent RNA helicase DDX3X